MANEISGLSALDPRVAATEKFIQEKNVPPDQVPEFLMTMGADPRLAGLVMKYQRLKQAGQDKSKAPPESTVAQDIDAQLQRQQGVASLPAPVMDNAQFAGGGVVALAGGGNPTDRGETSAVLLGGGPMGAMAFAPMAAQNAPRPLTTALTAQSDEEIARALAAAAIREDETAINDLSMVLRQRNRRDLVDNVVAEVQKQKQAVAGEQRAAQLGFTKPASSAAPAAPAPVVTPRRAPVMAAPAAAPPPAEKDITDEQYAKLRAFREREGLGAARGEMRQFLTDEEKRLDKTYGEDRRLAFAELGFKMAAAASRPGATFLGALSEGAISGAQALRGINKELAENKRLLKQSMIKLKEADELEKEGDYKAAMGLNKEARAEALKLYELRENLKLDREKIAAQRDATAATREYTASTQAERMDLNRVQVAERILQNTPYSMLQTQLINLKPDETEKAQQIQQQMATLQRDAMTRAGLGAEAEASVMNDIQNMSNEALMRAIQNIKPQ